MRIEVTAEDIRIGKPGPQCPISLAGRRASGKYTAVGVTRIWFMDEAETFALPDVAVTFIKRFDSHQPVEPFSFEVSAA